MNTPLTFLVDDFFRTKAMNQTNYFRLNKENAKDGRDHYFYFEVRLQNQVLSGEKFLSIFSMNY